MPVLIGTLIVRLPLLCARERPVLPELPRPVHCRIVDFADLGSFRAAAKRLSVTQPTVSMRIRELEHSLDTPLFDRSSYRPQLTANGREILKYAQRMMALMRDMRACALDGAGVVGTIRLGAADSFALAC